MQFFQSFKFSKWIKTHFSVEKTLPDLSAESLQINLEYLYKQLKFGIWSN